MAKNFLHDIRPVTHSGRRTKIEEEPLPESTRPVHLPPRFREKSFHHPEPRRSRRVVWILAVLVLLGAGIAFAMYFASAKVTITQKAESISLDNIIFNSTRSGDNETLSFKLVKVSGSAEKIVTGGTPTTINTKATGKVIIYNNYSKSPQKLAIETRLATNDGKIFKTDSAVTIPGIKTENGVQTPGSIEVGVHADQPGAAYNIGLSDFVIVGFKGTSKYDKFYARSKTVMTGGASGQGLALGEAEAKIAREAALTILREKLIAEAKTSLPESQESLETYVLVPGSFVLREDPDSGQTVADKNVMVVKGSLYGVIFEEEELTQKIATAVIPQFDGSDVRIPELEKFSITLNNKESINDDTLAVSFSISGDGHAVWELPRGEILEVLVGTSKRQVGQNLSSFPSVQKTEVDVFPFWIMKLPKSTDDIELVAVDPMAK